MNEPELQKLYQTQLMAQVLNGALSPYDQLAAGEMLEVSNRLLGTRLDPAEEHRMWVFSDPHFEHPASVPGFRWPFMNCAHGDAYLLEQWTRDVEERDTVVCLGDVTIEQPSDRLLDVLRRRPGRKVLIAGNHDKPYIRTLRQAFDVMAACAWLPGEPDLVFTLIPLDDVPDGAVNVHGHVHRKSAVENHRINVCVEQIVYRPIPMADVRTLARRMDRTPLSGNATTNLHIHWARNQIETSRKPSR